MNTRFIGVAGLPRAGSTLLCQLLAEHPEIYSEGHSSPLCPTLLNLRHNISDNEFFLAQSDVDFERSYAHLTDATRSFLRGWYANCERAVVIDKNRGWLSALDMLLHIEPDARLVVCTRELGQILGSIEAQHQRTLLIDFPEHTAHLDCYDRANVLFGKDGVIGGPLRALEAVQDLPLAMQKRIHVVSFERLMRDPLATMAETFQFIGVAPHKFDPQKLTVRKHESDSHYRHKYSHQQYPAVIVPHKHVLPRRIQAEIEKTYAWYYEHFYSDWIIT